MKIVIIGNGISGVTAARWIRKKSDHEITIISSETQYFYSRTALMYVYMGHMRPKDVKPYEDWFWEKNRINLVQDHVEQIDFELKTLKCKNEPSIAYDKLIIATGSKPNRFGWPGQDLEGVGSLYHWQDLERMEDYSAGLQRAVIVGGGLIGIEMAEMFRSRNIDVTLVVRESNYWNNVLPEEEASMISRHIEAHHIDLKLNVNLDAILDDGNGKAKAITIKETGEEIVCGYVGLTAGVSPNVSFLKESQLKIDRGILVDEFLRTNIDSVYAIGDCAQLQVPKPGRRNIEAVWYTGRMMGETVAHNICSDPIPYDPGIWFNSAKFLDIEYQVYGDIPNTLPDEVGSFYWEHKDGLKSIRINFDKSSEEVLGFNLMGIRFRHEVCEKWIKEKTPMDKVVGQLKLANFDPEFYQRHESEILTQYNKQFKRSLQLESKGSYNHIFQFLRSR